MAEQFPAFPAGLTPPPRRRLASVRAIMALVLREMATTYGRSPLGYLWAILEPVGGIVLLTIVFSVMVRQPPLGISFAIFYATGIVPFFFYSDISGKLMRGLMYSRQLLVYPSVSFMDALLARFILAVLTQLLVTAVVFGGVLMIFANRTVLNPADIGLSLAMATALGFGVGTLNCFLTGMAEAWGRIWAILNRPLFLISCVFFLYEMVPQPFREILWYNPLVHVVAVMRRGFYPYYDAAYVSPVYVFGLALGLAALGLLLLRRYYRVILNS